MQLSKKETILQRARALLLAFLADEDGASATEYAVLVAAIVVGLYAAFQLFNLGGIYTDVGTKVTNCMTSSC